MSRLDDLMRPLPTDLPRHSSEELAKAEKALAKLHALRAAEQHQLLWERIILALIAGKCYTDDDISIDNLRKDAADVLTVIKAGPPRGEP